ncbi:MAG: helix-turn-helix domain-containing protein [Planctomycetales bacterium]
MAETATSFPAMLTLKEVAQRFACHPDHVLRLIDAGRLSAVNIAVGKKNRKLRIDPAALAEFIASATTAPPPPEIPKPRRRIRYPEPAGPFPE